MGLLEACWRVEKAARAAFLIDYQAFYAAVDAALREARHSVILLGWAFDPRTRLRPDGQRAGDAPDQIGRILLDLARDRPGIDIRVLVWRSSLAISASQEFFPHRAKGWFKDAGVRFVLDDMVPFGACHHQKALIIDGRLAFTGSGDFAGDRWDSPAHQDQDMRRMMPSGRCHGARHEVMMVSEGPVVEALLAMAGERWLRATGETLPAIQASQHDLWPAHLLADIAGADIGIARTEPAWHGRPKVDEALRLTLDLIARARRILYIENQYFTAPPVAEAIARRLAEPDGPEIVLVSTGRSPSWFDRATMDRARAVAIWRLRAADIFGRLRTWRPVTPGGHNIIVHSKVMVVDDRIARIGSANLNNRSGGFDTECDLAIDAATEDQRAAVERLRDTLIGHFVGRPAKDVADARARHGGFIAAVESLNRAGRLQPIDAHRLGPFGEFVAAHHLGDPAETADSWHPFRRRERLYEEVRAPTDRSTTSGR